jgi:hypothetical protein
MPFAFTLRFLHYIEEWAEAGAWAHVYTVVTCPCLNIFCCLGKDVELTARCLFYLLKLHHNRLVSSQVMAGALDNLRLKLRSQLEQLKVLCDRLRAVLVSSSYCIALGHHWLQSSRTRFFKKLTDRKGH